MFLAADGEDGNGLQLENLGPAFSSSSIVLKLFMVGSSFKEGGGGGVVGGT